MYVGTSYHFSSCAAYSFLIQQMQEMVNGVNSAIHQKIRSTSSFLPELKMHF